MFCPNLSAQSALTTPVTVTAPGSSTTLLSVGSSGALTTQGSLSAGNTALNPGQITLLGAGVSGSLSIQAPSAFSGSGSFSWVVPSAAIPGTGPSLLQITPSGTMYYAAVTGLNGLNISQSAGSLAFSLGSSLNLSGSMPSLNDSSGNQILALSSTGAGNYVRISNDTSGTVPPAGPQINSAGPGTGPIPLQVGDYAGGGVELNSNGGIAMKVLSTASAPVTFAAVNASPSGTFAGNSGVQVAAANAAATGDLSLVVKGQNNGSVYIGSNVDAASSAFSFEIAADRTTGVAQSNLVYVNTTGNAIKPAGAVRPIAGIAMNTATTGNAIVAYSGKALCIFENTAVPGDYVVQGFVTVARCHDAGASLPTMYQVLGTVLDAAGDVLLRIGN